MGEYKIGQTVQTPDDRQGIIRFIGTGSFASGEWIGLELSDDSGKNDGSVMGERYFDCPPGHGIFIRREAVKKVLKQPAPSATPRAPVKPANGVATRPRPSVSITADQARKRQSLMGSGTTLGSRLSIRSPTKSPTKTAHSSASSATSTPRTGTPATTNRTSDSSAKSRLSSHGRPSMGPPAPTRATGKVSRPSIGGVPSSATKTGSRPQPRQSLGGLGLTARPKPSRPAERPPSDVETVKESHQSLTIAEEEDEAGVRLPDQLDEGSDFGSIEPTPAPSTKFHSLSQVSTRAAPVARSAANGGFDSRGSSLREIESLKSKLRIVEKKRQEDRDKMKTLDDLQTERDKFENIINVLQKKLKATQQDTAELCEKLNDAEARAGQVDSANGEHESELELATLDKEMAEERAEAFKADLDALKMKHDELELEFDLLKEETRELGSVMTPEEKASAGWLQIEKEKERLRQALVMLRDLSQETESDLRSQVKELQEELSESEALKVKFQETSERLSKYESTNKHLMEQLEAAESNEDVTTALEHEKEAHLNQIEFLKQKIQDLEEEVQVNDDLETFHVAAENELQSQLDEAGALLHEKQNQNNEQATALADLEYTLSKFRDVVSGLQSDIDELRRSKDISELEAHEMSSKSRAMMDLNLQLQNSAAKTQMKTIDVELGKIKAEEAFQKLNIVQLFLQESFDGEKNSVFALLCVKRIKSKAALVSGVLRDRMKDRPHLMQDEPFLAYEVIEKLSWITACCERFVRFISTCDVAAFGKLNNILFELEPVERTVNGWIEALKRDELSKEGPEHLMRMSGILSDLSEKLITDTLENKSTELLASTTMVESYCDSMTSHVAVIMKVVQDRLGPPSDENEESLHFDKKIDKLSTKARTIKFLTGKTIQALEEMRARSMGLGESTWLTFEEAELLGKEICKLVRSAGLSLVEELAKDEHDQPITYQFVSDLLTSSVTSHLDPRSASNDGPGDDIFAILSSKLQKLHGMVEDMHLKAQDLSLTSEYEKAPAPWTIRAKEIRSQKIISPDLQEELSRLKTRVQEQLTGIAGKDRQLEEQTIKIELLESRTKETKVHSETLQKLESEVKVLRSKTEQAEQELEDAKTSQRALQQTYDDMVLELDTLKKEGAASNGAVPSTPDHGAILAIRADNSLLKTEIVSLQAAVRWLKGELHRSKLPMSTTSSLAKEHAWLDPKTLTRAKRTDPTQEKIKKEADAVWAELLEVSRKAELVVLKPSSEMTNTGLVLQDSKRSLWWRAMRETPSYKVLKQREEIERWEGFRAEVAKSARVANRIPTTKQGGVLGEHIRAKKKPDVLGVHAVEIVGATSP